MKWRPTILRDCWLCDLTERAEEIEYALRVAEHNIERPEIWAAIEALAARLKHGRKRRRGRKNHSSIAMQKTRTQLKATAYHEAGHAVIGRVLTLSCGRASIKPDRAEAGHALTDDPHSCLHEWEKRGKVREKGNAVWHARIMTYMAVAETLNARGIRTARGGTWATTQVSDILRRASTLAHYQTAVTA